MSLLSTKLNNEVLMTLSLAENTLFLEFSLALLLPIDSIKPSSPACTYV